MTGKARGAGTMRRLLFAFTLVIIITACSTFSASSEFEEGQRWAYQTRPHEPDSTLLIIKLLDTEYLGNPITAVFVVVEGICFNDDRTIVSPMGFAITEDALRQSVTELIGSEEIDPGYLGFYSEWSVYHDEGNEAIFDVPLAQTLDEYIQPRLDLPSAE